MCPGSEFSHLGPARPVRPHSDGGPGQEKQVGPEFLHQQTAGRSPLVQQEAAARPAGVAAIRLHSAIAYKAQPDTIYFYPLIQYRSACLLAGNHCLVSSRYAGRAMEGAGEGGGGAGGQREGAVLRSTRELSGGEGEGG